MDAKKHTIYMQRALQLAKLGSTNAYPNPLVGAVIVYNNQIIGEGWHKKYGAAHAEVNAINDVNDPSLLKKSTLYVTLEPCSHHGKTPPCSDLIINKGIKEVVIGCIDTFSEVSGRGVEKLKKAGINVQVGVLEKKARELNKRFFSFHEKRRPYVILKWAESNDGFLDIERNDNDRRVNWITQKETKSFVHQLRSKEHGILVGWKTIKNDNPSLTVREVKGRSPIRFVIDPRSQCPKESKVFTDGNTTYLLCQKNHYSFKNKNTRVIEISDFNLNNILHKLHDLQIISLFIEGGGYTLQQFIDEGLWDEAYQIVGTPRFEKGVKAPLLSNASSIHRHFLGDDCINHYKNQ